MTRFARGGQANRKKPHEASSWPNMSAGVKKKQAGGTSQGKLEHAILKRHKLSNHLAGTNKFSKANHANKHDKSSKFEGSDTTCKQQHSSLGSVKKNFTESDDGSIIFPSRKDEETPLGLAAELQQLKQTSSLTETDEREICEIIKKDKRREQRRMKRVEQRQSGKVCFNCRETGHDMADCPQTSQSADQGTGICFKCASTEHTVARCRLKLPAGHFPYATCFICKEQGHLSKQCPDNAKGLYPMGGCCKLCGSVEHFKKDCPDLQKQQGIKDMTLQTWASPFSVDEEASLFEKKETLSKKKTPKVVKF